VDVDVVLVVDATTTTETMFTWVEAPENSTLHKPLNRG